MGTNTWIEKAHPRPARQVADPGQLKNGHLAVTVWYNRVLKAKALAGVEGRVETVPTWSRMETSRCSSDVNKINGRADRQQVSMGGRANHLLRTGSVQLFQMEAEFVWGGKTAGGVLLSDWKATYDEVSSYQCAEPGHSTSMLNDWRVPRCMVQAFL